MYRRIIEFDGVLGWLLIDIAKKNLSFEVLVRFLRYSVYRW